MPASQSLGGESPGVRIGALHLALHPRPPGAQRKHKVFSHLSVVSPQAGGGCRALQKAGGSEEAGAFSLLVPSLLSLCASSRENRELEI